MNRGLIVPLSPNEEVTLRRVAHGMASAKMLQPAHLARLRTLALIEDRDGALGITELGQQRLANKQVGRLDTSPIAIDDSVIALAKALKVTKL